MTDDENIRPVTELRRLGFSQYEAQAYVALLQRYPLNGYELAKESGVPRANIYAVLRKLEERGAAVRLDTPEGQRYTPVLPRELILKLRNSLQSNLDQAQQELLQLSTRGEQEPVWNFNGYSTSLEHARALINGAQKELLVALSPQEVASLSDRLRAAEARGVSLSYLCMAGCPQQCSACPGKVYRYKFVPQDQNRWLLVISDSSEVLAAEMAPGGVTQAVRTRQKLLVDLSIGYIRHSIALATLLLDLGNRLDQLVSPETRATLASLGPSGQDQDWIAYLQTLLRSPAQMN